MLRSSPFKQQAWRWRFRLQSWKRFDWALLIAPVVLTVVSTLAIHSVQLNQGYNDALQQCVMGLIGLGAALALSRLDYQVWLQWHWLTYAATNLILLVVIAAGTSANGAQSWLTLGSFNIQPSEFAKVGVILTQAALLHQDRADNLVAILRVFGITLIPWALVLAQPDLGTSLVFGAITLVMLYWANAKLGWIILMISPLVAAIVSNLPLPMHLSLVLWGLWTLSMGVVGWMSFSFRFPAAFASIVVNLASAGLGQFIWSKLKEYQKDRLTLFLDPDRDPLGGGYHLIQSRIAIGSGGPWGHGLNQGTQTQLGFIPEQHTDFIFSAIGEELGFVGCIAVLLLFWIICVRLLVIARTSRDNFGSLLAIGVLAMIFFQVLINVGMTIGLSPVTGIPLPWLSYGRSSLLTNFIALGIVESVAYLRPKRRRRHG
jgi:rod shape determining protein RodA